MGILPQTLQQTLQQTKTSLLEKKLLFSRIGKLESLPLPSPSLLNISTVLKSNPSDSTAITDVIQHDHVMLAQLLRLFYSTFPGVEAESIQTIVEMLAPEQLRTLSYIPRMLESFESGEEQEWNHSYSVKILMESLLADNEVENPALITAAHLHDIGKNVLRDWSPKKYKIIETHAQSSQNIPFYKLEDAVLQTNHAEVGGELLKNWNFPEAVWKPVAQHHDETVPEEYVFETALLQFVNWTDCRARGIECEPPSKDLLTAAGIQEIDSEGYLEAQKNLIANLRAANAGAIRKNMLNDLINAEHAASLAENAASGAPEKAEMEENLRSAALAAQQEVAEETAAEAEGPFDPGCYQAASMPGSVAKREAELLRKMGLK